MEEIKRKWEQEKKEEMKKYGEKYRKKVDRMAILGAFGITITLVMGAAISACSQTSQELIMGLVITTLLAMGIFVSISFYMKRQSSKLMANLDNKQNWVK